MIYNSMQVVNPSGAIVRQRPRPMGFNELAVSLSDETNFQTPTERFVLTPFVVKGQFATEASRAAYAVSSAGNGQVFHQLDDNTFWRIENGAFVAYTPPTPADIAIPAQTVPVAKVKRLVNVGWPSSSQTGPSGDIWALSVDTTTSSGANSANPANGPTQADYDTWKANQTVPYPSLNNLSYWRRADGTTNTMTFNLSGFPANASVKVTIYCYIRPADWYGAAWKWPLRVNGVVSTVQTQTGLMTLTVTGTATAAGLVVVQFGGAEAATAGFICSALKVEEV